MATSNSIAAVATRIQEKATQLITERSLLQQAQSKLQKIKTRYEAETGKNNQIRKEVLTLQRARNGMELDNVINLQDAIISYENKISKMRTECKLGEKTLEDLGSEWTRMENNVYARHEAKLELFKRKIEGTLKRRKMRKKKRLDYLSNLAQISAEADQSATLIHKERENARNEILQMDLSEEKEDEEISALAMNIRATVAKRTSLRTAIQHAQEFLKEANENLLECEKERIKLTHK